MSDERRDAVEAPNEVLLQMMAAWNDTFGSPLTRYQAMYLIAAEHALRASPSRDEALEEAARAIRKRGEQICQDPEICFTELDTGATNIARGWQEYLEALDDAEEIVLALQSQPAAQPHEQSSVPGVVDAKFKDFAARCRPAVRAHLNQCERSLLKGKDGTFAPHYLKVLEHDADRAQRLLDEIDALIGQDTGPHEPPVPPHHIPVA